MTVVSVVLGICCLAVTITESKELVIFSTYPESDNFSYIELVCAYDSDNDTQSGVIGASFLLNGTDIEEEIDSVETVTDANSTIHFLLAQDKEGFFTCSLNGLLSNNSVGLAGE